MADEAPHHHELSEQILAAEQDERRRIALFLHDGPVQSLAGIALMLDAALHFIDKHEDDQAREAYRATRDRLRRRLGGHAAAHPMSIVLLAVTVLVL